MRNLWNHELMKLNEEKYIGKAITVEYGQMACNEIPFVNFEEEISQICGELYEVSAHKMNKLDRLELGSGYKKEIIKVIQLIEDDP